MQGRDIVAGLRAYIFFVWWPEQAKTHFKWKLCPRHTGIVYFNLTAWNTWIPQPLLSLANWRCTTSRPLTLSCVGLYPAEMLEMFFHFVCLFFFVFLPCECRKHNSLCTNPLARHKCCCAVRLYLIVIYCPNDFHIAADSSSNVAVPLQCTVFVHSLSQDSFMWCFLIGHVATFSCRHAFVLLLSLASPPSYSVKSPQLAVNSK